MTDRIAELIAAFAWADAEYARVQEDIAAGLAEDPRIQQLVAACIVRVPAEQSEMLVAAFVARRDAKAAVDAHAASLAEHPRVQTPIETLIDAHMARRSPHDDAQGIPALLLACGHPLPTRRVFGVGTERWCDECQERFEVLPRRVDDLDETLALPDEDEPLHDDQAALYEAGAYEDVT